jgi:mRNA export factor
VVGGGADKAARMIDLQSNQTQQVAAHEQPISCVKIFQHQGNQMLITGSWDKTVKYWDCRSSNPVATLNCQDRVYCMDVNNKLLVIGTAERYIDIVNLDNPTQFFKTMQSPLKWQTRVVTCFPDSKGFAVGSIEGRCAIQYVDDSDASYVSTFTPPRY